MADQTESDIKQQAFSAAMTPPRPLPETPLMKAIDAEIKRMKVGGLEPIFMIMSRAKRRQLRDEISTHHLTEYVPESLSGPAAFGLQVAAYRGVLISTRADGPLITLYGRDRQGRGFACSVREATGGT